MTNTQKQASDIVRAFIETHKLEITRIASRADVARSTVYNQLNSGNIGTNIYAAIAKEARCDIHDIFLSA